MKGTDFTKHVKGESSFIDDFILPEGTLYAAVKTSDCAHAIIKKIITNNAVSLPGVKAVFTARDIPGENQIGGIVADETLLAANEISFAGEPLALIVADNKITAKAAAELIRIEKEILIPVTNAREAAKKGQLIVPPKIFSGGNVEEAWKDCDIIIEGTVESGGQEHVYLETQGALSIPVEGGGIKIYSSTQSPTAVQRAAARILNLPMNKIEVDVLRLGGGFGGKEDQATPWAVMSALAAYKLNIPVKLVLSRMDDLRMTGKRHPYSSDYKIGLKSDGKIISYEVTYYQNAGACADLSPAILERTLFHATNSYYIPNVKATAYSCKTNLIPNTAFRGFGGPQGKFVIEAAIHKASKVMNIPAYEIQKKNLISEGDYFYYGQKAERCNARKCWTETEKRYNPEFIQNEIHKFNSESRRFKKGMAFMPICFGISFTSTFMNQASALVHVYTDGSVGISTAAVEMGQGVNAKIITAAAQTLSINPDRIKIESTNTTRAANTSPTAASSAADLNGNAVILACREILDRLKKVAAQELKLDYPKKFEVKDEKILFDGAPTKLKWEDLVRTAYYDRVSLSAQAHYATPGIYFNRKSNTGRPFAYHVYGTAIITATVDCLLGIYKIDSVKVVHDFGKSMNPIIDRGQAEGAIAQGIGWMTLEEIAYSSDGKLLSNSLSAYKVPDVYASADNVEIHFLEDSENPFGPFNSKAVGEPPLMYGIGAYFAIVNAMKAFKPEKEYSMKAPLTPERVLLELYGKAEE